MYSVISLLSATVHNQGENCCIFTKKRYMYLRFGAYWRLYYVYTLVSLLLKKLKLQFVIFERISTQSVLKQMLF